MTGRERSELHKSAPDWPPPANPSPMLVVERRMRRLSTLTDFLRQDLRHALRSMARHPGFALVTALTLALGIGANTAIFSVVDAVLLAPLPYADPSRLVIVWETMPGDDQRGAAPA